MRNLWLRIFSLLRYFLGARVRAYSLMGMALLAVFLATPRRTNSQTSTASAALSPRVVYGQVFKHIVLLDALADKADQQGQNGSVLRSYYQTKAGLTSAEAALVKNTAHATVTSVAAIDTQIRAAVALFRAQNGSAHWSRKNPPPPAPASLLALQAQKDAAIQGGLAALQSGLGAARFLALDKFVQTDVQPHITVSTATTTTSKPAIPAPGSASGLPPLTPMPWQGGGQ